LPFHAPGPSSDFCQVRLSDSFPTFSGRLKLPPTGSPMPPHFFFLHCCLMTHRSAFSDKLAPFPLHPFFSLSPCLFLSFQLKNLCQTTSSTFNARLYPCFFVASLSAPLFFAFPQAVFWPTGFNSQPTYSFSAPAFGPTLPV